ncbi:MAG: glycosyltransferase family 2 protein [Patescibacteria group bacterium]
MISINLIVRDGEKYIRQCLDAVLAQSCQDFELIIFDNDSTDRTKEIINSYHLSPITYNLIENPVNLGPWGGFEESLKYSHSEFVVLLSVDVILDKDFIKNALAVMEQDEKIGALQAKVKQWCFSADGQPEKTDLIDTLGFKIFRNRRLINIGQGEEDRGQYDQEKEIFGVEGAVPVFRREALEDCRLPRGSTSGEGEIVDHDMFWYGDDLDLVWRMRLFGWKQVYVPSVIAWHDRSTTKDTKQKWYDYFFRVGRRRQIPIRKRRLDWRNYRLAIIKNDYMINILRDWPRIAAREIMVLGYAILFESQIFLEIPTFLKLLPKTLNKRKKIMLKAKIGPKEIRQWFH